MGVVSNLKHAETLLDMHVIGDKLLHVTFQACTVARMRKFVAKHQVMGCNRLSNNYIIKKSIPQLKVIGRYI